MTRIKICGITNIDDATAAIGAGADMLGFVFAESSRRVEISTVLGILAKLPPLTSTVGVFANQTGEEICEIMLRTGISLAQMHDGITDNTSSIITKLGCRRLIHAVRMNSKQDLEIVKSYSSCGCVAILLDAHVEGKMGGTGRTFDWDLAVQAKSLGKPIILAGGLTPENVAKAVRKVQPYAVDVSSGVESSPGKKDHDKIREFINNVRNA